MFEFNNKETLLQEKDKKQTLEVIIDPEYVVFSQIDVSSLICSICHQILWQPVMCSISQGCHNYFCRTCIDSWIANQINKQKHSQITEIPQPSCPQCKLPLTLSSPPPLLKSLLSNLKIKCIFTTNGCDKVLSYQSIEQHAFQECKFRNVACEGCEQLVVWKNYQEHTQNCELFVIKCEKCQEEMTKKHYLNMHVEWDEGDQENSKSSLRTVQCYSYEITNYRKSIQSIQSKTYHLGQRLSTLQTLTNHLIKDSPLHLPITFQTGFNEHFAFLSPLTPTLIKPSFNPIKNRNDFLHFYITSPIYLNSLFSFSWNLSFTRMKGNILLGFCSSIRGESVDLIVNKYGEMKKKQLKENRYKLVKRVEGFVLEEKNVIGFLYDGRKKLLKISNRSRNVSVELGKEYIEMIVKGKEVGTVRDECMYAFYSMDTVGDKIEFMEET